MKVRNSMLVACALTLAAPLAFAKLDSSASTFRPSFSASLGNTGSVDLSSIASESVKKDAADCPYQKNGKWTDLSNLIEPPASGLVPDGKGGYRKVR